VTEPNESSARVAEMKTRTKPGRPTRPSPGTLRPRLALLLAAAVLAACSIEPQPIHLGSAECDQCRMVIGEPQFASQALTTKGKAYTFDTVECLAEWLRTGPVAADDLHSLWVADFSEPDRWVPAGEARFVRSAATRSPMGMGLSAFASAATAEEHRRALDGEVLGWTEVLTLVEREGAHARHAHDHDHDGK
jgi:copper chaperone NosL